MSTLLHPDAAGNGFRPPNRPRAIPTEYGGVPFRSRLEARYAAFFDLLGLPWEYEPFSLETGYTPDFLVQGPAPVLVEVRPCSTFEEYLYEYARLRERRAHEYDGYVVLLGTSPLPDPAALSGQVRWCEDCRPSTMNALAWDGMGPLAGMYLHGPVEWNEEPYYLTWTFCLGEDDGPTCGRAAWFHPEGSYRALPCGHWSGDHHLGVVTSEWLRGLWGRAHGMTRWRPAG